MTAFAELVRRNLRIYLRDTGAVFFSLLSMLIVIVLMVFFLGDMNVSSITSALGELPGRDATEDRVNAVRLVLQWTCAGVISINAVTVTLSVLSAMIRDRGTGKLQSIYTAPVSRLTIAVSYISAAWLASMMICTLTLALSEAYCVWQGAAAFSFMDHLILLGMMAVNSFTYACIMYCLAVLVRSEGAWSGLGTVIGTLVGFLGGIYLPIGSLADSIAMVLKCTPIFYGTVMFRQLMTERAAETCFAGAPEEMRESYCEAVGVTLKLGSHTVGIGTCLGILLACGMVFLLLGAAVTKYGRHRDR